MMAVHTVYINIVALTVARYEHTAESLVFTHYRILRIMRPDSGIRRVPRKAAHCHGIVFDNRAFSTGLKNSVASAAGNIVIRNADIM